MVWYSLDALCSAFSLLIGTVAAYAEYAPVPGSFRKAVRMGSGSAVKVTKSQIQIVERCPNSAAVAGPSRVDVAPSD